ncbi:hypothetical protein EMIT048CA2_230002 [Pseudomonas chlororaphis]
MRENAGAIVFSSLSVKGFYLNRIAVVDAGKVAVGILAAVGVVVLAVLLLAELVVQLAACS